MKAIENNGRIYPVLGRNVLLISQMHDVHKHMTGSHVLWGLSIDTYFYTIQSNTLLKKSKHMIYKLFFSWGPKHCPHKVNNYWYYFLCGDIWCPQLPSPQRINATEL